MIPGAAICAPEVITMKKRTIILLVFVVLVLGAGVLFISAAADQSEHSSTDGEDTDDGRTYDARIAWTYTLKDSVTSKSGYTSTADAGMQFIIIDFVVANDRVSNGIDLGSGDDIDWTVTYNGIGYSDPSFELYSLPGFQNITVTKGYTGTDVWMTEIPDTATYDDVKITAKAFLSLFTLKYDSSLLSEDSDVPPADSDVPPTDDDEDTELPPADAAVVRANWRADEGHTLTNSVGFTMSADDGKKFVVVTYTLTNNTDTPIELNMLIFKWQLIASGVGYDALFGTTVAYMDGYSSSTVYEGGTATQYLVYEIPEDAVVAGYTTTYVGSFDPSTIVRDKSIEIDAPKELS